MKKIINFIDDVIIKIIYRNGKLYDNYCDFMNNSGIYRWLFGDE